jgi:nucleotidyltransferase substrate binding protein (TIGR01987 family)
MSDKLRNLLRLLNTALSRLDLALAQPVNEFVRDSSIQRFEFTFELFWKSLKAYAEESGLEAFSPRDSIRIAFQLGVIQESPEWFRMLEDRNLTSHTYNEATADSSYSHFPTYTRLVRQALEELTRRAKD